MTLPRYAARRDANEATIRLELADCGWLTQPLSIEDWPDLLCAKAGRLHLLEIKNKDGRDTVSDGQTAVHGMLRLFGIEVVVARTTEEFLRAVGDLH